VSTEGEGSISALLRLRRGYGQRLFHQAAIVERAGGELLFE
jgi:hypothetical protein